MTTTKGFITGAATTALDTRKADAAKLVHSAAGVPRAGVLGVNPSIVTADGSTAPMRVAVAKADFATTRGVADGVALWTNDGSIFVTVTKPLSNSHYVVVYAKHNDTTAGDPDNNPVIETVTGAAAASPAVPAVPSGALELARILIPSTATATTSAGVVITNTYPMTAMRGGQVAFRTTAERNAFADELGVLPDPVTVVNAGVFTVTAAAGTWQLVTGVTYDLVLTEDCWVEITAGAWLASAAGDTRMGIDVAGATSSAPNLPTWGSVLIGGTGSTTPGTVKKTIKLNAGTNTISVRGYRSETTAAHSVSYCVLEITPLRFAL